ncbi:hypothetical protein ABH930_000330 [Kitasatospora sp. GAS204A]|uniref:hypothetical protein n=1 Tax=unclassified Kitasatospora TaxID=2633591 RepID=UPI002472FEF1|nr:hypothetical protein [Kitasatospora sp. GAS204B]MDH6116911.1 hypothetical protein [Kitasatospora sp. GAS204B]
MAINITGILDALQSHALSTGLFDQVSGHEPKNPPGNGLVCAFWSQAIGPVQAASGLAITTGRLEFNARLYSSFVQQPEDAIDPNLIAAVDTLLTAYSGDFELGGNVRNIDLLGQTGTPLSAQAGYLNQGGKTYRVFTIVLPAIVNDLWGQS